jgi:uncharacterized membrane protein YhaH (DUF805 family)
MDVSSSGRLKKMGFNPNSPKSPELDSELSKDKQTDELSETGKLRLAKKAHELSNTDNKDSVECPACGIKLEPGAIICIDCEINASTGKKVKTKLKFPKNHNAYAAPQANNDLDEKQFFGLSRGKYWLWSFLIPILSMALSFTLILALGANYQMIENPNVMIPFGIIAVLGGVYLLMITSLIYIQTKRLRNLGSSAWQILFHLVPILNIWLIFKICCCPEGYADHKTLDKNGKILSGIFVFFVIFILFLYFSL